MSRVLAARTIRRVRRPPPQSQRAGPPHCFIGATQIIAEYWVDSFRGTLLPSSSCSGSLSSILYDDYTTLNLRLFSTATTKPDSGEKKDKQATKTPKKDKQKAIKNSTALEKKGEMGSMITKGTDAASWAVTSLASLLARTPAALWFYLTHPRHLRAKLAELRDLAVKEAHHYWMGSKLLVADVRTARHIMGRTLQGSTLSRRERRQLLRTVTDVFRLVPMSVFVLIPFMEFALPFALKLFPNMLPSTFQDSLKEEEKMKGELQMRISMAGFLQDSLAELAKDQKKWAQKRRSAVEAGDGADGDYHESIEMEKEATASEFLEFLKKARTGQAIPPSMIINFSKYFKDDATLDNMSRVQLFSLCKYMGIPPYGNDNLLRFQLRHRIRLLKEDDQRILWEGIDSLTKMELREACRERGMRSTGLSKVAYKKALQQWLELSVEKNVPISLLIMSRTFFLHDEMVSDDVTDDGSSGMTGLADAMSGIDKEVVNEIVLDMASPEEKSQNADVMKIQLEVLEQQNEMIKEEQEERDAAAKDKEEKERAKEELEEKEEAAKMVGESPLKDSEAIISTEAASTDDAIMGEKLEASIKGISDAEQVDTKEEEYTELSTDEIDAISQLAFPDSLAREKEQLQRIKDKMQEKNEEDIEKPSELEDEQGAAAAAADASLEMSSAISPSGPILTEEAQEEAGKSLKELEEAVEEEAKKLNIVSTDSEDEVIDKSEEEEVGDVKLQKAIDRLKYRVESMVGKIETQMSDVEVKIGDKFHLLDKDGDQNMTMEEMAQVLQTVLKRELTAEEAMAIAADMDANKDGVFSIAELAQWAETNTLVKLAEDGREKDLDEVITERVADLKERERREKEAMI